MHKRIFPNESDLRPNIWASSEEVTPNFFLRVSVSIGMLRAVTSAFGNSAAAVFKLLLSKGRHLLILNSLPKPLIIMDFSAVSASIR